MQTEGHWKSFGSYVCPSEHKKYPHKEELLLEYREKLQQE